jgi:hypothetical protein
MPRTEQLNNALNRVKTGNAGHQPDGFTRDLSLRKPEYWETRPYPNVLWHWTEAEFDQFLTAHRFPPNTLRDREVGRMLALRSALVKGEFIPREVMDDASTVNAVADAVMEIQSRYAGEARNHEQQLGTLAFEKAIGLHSTAEYCLRRGALLAQAACATGRRATDSGCTLILSDIKEVGLDGLGFNLTVSLRTPTKENRHSGSKQWLEIRDARYNDVSLYGDVHRIPFERAETIFRNLMESNQVTLDQARSLMGPYWAPYLHVAVTTSVPTPA